MPNIQRSVWADLGIFLFQIIKTTQVRSRKTETEGSWIESQVAFEKRRIRFYGIINILKSQNKIATMRPKDGYHKMTKI